MTLAETFDTHIKAISTAKEWRKYKTLMSTENKIRALTEPKMMTYDPKVFSETLGRISNVNEDRPMKYKVNVDIIDGYDKGDTISNAHYHSLLDYGCPKKWFEPIEQIKEGQYWACIDLDRVVRVCEVKMDKVLLQELSDDSPNTKYDRKSYLLGAYRKISTHEVEEVLIKEAKRRGLLTNGNKVATLANDGVAPSNIYNHVIPKEYLKICYNPDCDQLEMQLSSEFGDWIRLYKGGVILQN